MEKNKIIKRIFNWQVVMGVALILMSATVYYIHYLIFRDAHHIFIYLVGDIGFVFIEVLLVTMVLHQLLNNREKQTMLKKLNMVIGVFFNEIGTELLRVFPSFDTEISDVTNNFVVTNQWSEKKFRKALLALKGHDCVVDVAKGDLSGLKEFLIMKRQFLLNLMGNPNLLEHESFTNLLWAIFHLTSELLHRADLSSLPDADRRHLGGDIQRAYRFLIIEWLSYMKHLKNDYPYLFSLAVRTNPFDKEASVIIK